MTTDGTLLADGALDALRAAHTMSPAYARDRCREILDLFEIPSVALAATGIEYPDTLDDRDGALLMTLLAVFEARFPLA